MRTVRVRAVIQYAGKFLFVQHAPASEYWALPGGRVEKDEELMAALERELVEELNVTPEIGRLLYIQQLFMPEGESLEFFFEVRNGRDFVDADWRHSTHGALELAKVEFINPQMESILPEFLTDLSADLEANEFPKVLVRHSERL